MCAFGSQTVDGLFVHGPSPTMMSRLSDRGEGSTVSRHRGDSGPSVMTIDISD